MTIEQRFDTIQNQLNTVCELLQLSITSLNTKKAVARFLNKSEKTIDNYINNNTFIEDKHYFINENNRIEFIPFSIACKIERTNSVSVVMHLCRRISLT